MTDMLEELGMKITSQQISLNVLQSGVNNSIVVFECGAHGTTYVNYKSKTRKVGGAKEA